MKKNETKHMDFQFDIKAIEEDGTFSGYASVFDVVDSQKDVILKGAFKRTLEERNGDIKLLWQHKLDEPIGIFLSLREDSHGLFVHGKLLLGVKRAKEAYELLKSGAINGMSIGYSVGGADFDDENGIRFITDVDLFEVSLVTFPANESATITSVKGEGIPHPNPHPEGEGIAPATLREFEKLLRTSGFSRSRAKGVALYGFEAEDELKELESSIDMAIGVLCL